MGLALHLESILRLIMYLLMHCVLRWNQQPLTAQGHPHTSVRTQLTEAALPRIKPKPEAPSSFAEKLPTGEPQQARDAMKQISLLVAYKA